MPTRYHCRRELEHLSILILSYNMMKSVVWFDSLAMQHVYNQLCLFSSCRVDDNHSALDVVECFGLKQIFLLVTCRLHYLDVLLQTTEVGGPTRSLTIVPIPRLGRSTRSECYKIENS